MEDKQLEDAMAETIEKSFNDSELEDIMNEIENLEKEFSDDVTSGDLVLKEAKPNSLQDAIDAEVNSIVDEVSPSLEVEAAPEVEPLVEPAPEAVEEVELVAQESEAVAEESEPIVEEVESAGEVAMVAEETEIVSEEIETVAEIEEEEETVAFSEEELAAVAADTAEDEVESNIVDINSGAGDSRSKGGTLDFNASGSMDLNINFKVAGQTASLKVEEGGLSLHMNGVELTINEESGCTVSMDGGVNFSIPLDASKAGKKAA